MSACACMDKVDQRLAEAGANTRLSRSFYLGDSVSSTVTIATKAVEKKRGHSPWSVKPTFCPFCGVKLSGATPEAPVLWAACKPTAPGDYYVRGFTMFASVQYEALVQVRYHHFDRQPQKELVCNLHVSTSEDDMDEWNPIAEMSDDFEWSGPVYRPEGLSHG